MFDAKSMMKTFDLAIHLEPHRTPYTPVAALFALHSGDVARVPPVEVALESTDHFHKRKLESTSLGGVDRFVTSRKLSPVTSTPQHAFSSFPQRIDLSCLVPHSFVSKSFKLVMFPRFSHTCPHQISVHEQDGIRLELFGI